MKENKEQVNNFPYNHVFSAIKNIIENHEHASADVTLELISELSIEELGILMDACHDVRSIAFNIRIAKRTLRGENR